MQQQRRVGPVLLHSSLSTGELVTVQFRANQTPNARHFTTPTRTVRQLRQHTYRPQIMHCTVPTDTSVCQMLVLWVITFRRLDCILEQLAGRKGSRTAQGLFTDYGHFLYKKSCSRWLQNFGLVHSIITRQSVTSTKPFVYVVFISTTIQALNTKRERERRRRRRRRRTIKNKYKL